MFEPKVAAVDPLMRERGGSGPSDNGYAFSIPPGRGMSHNLRTLQDKWSRSARLVLERRLTQRNGGLA